MWLERIQLMLAKGPSSKDKFLNSILKQIQEIGEPPIPTASQKILLNRFWESYEKKKLAELLGEDGDWMKFLLH